MKRFFKKASLVLVALCLVVGSTLPSFATLRLVNGTIHDFETKNIKISDDGDTDDDDDPKAYVYREFYFTGTYDDESIALGNLSVSAECSGGDLDSHEIWLYVDMVARYQGETYHDEVAECYSTEENSRILSQSIDHPYTVIHTAATSYAWIDMIATGSGENWCKTHRHVFTHGETGWQ